MDYEKLEDMYGVSDGEALFYYCKNFHLDPENLDDDDLDDFYQAYVCEFDSVEDYAYSMVRDSGMLLDPVFLAKYFDYKAYARDLLAGGDIWYEDTSTGVYIYVNS